jgi:aromatic-L-amino-acid/L-tryptophan decarboxylase
MIAYDQLTIMLGGSVRTPYVDENSLDPADWDAFRVSAHAALDDAIAFLRTVEERPVWRPVPEDVRKSLDEPLPVQGKTFDDVYVQFKEQILPYATGNIHPRFFGWVHGAGLASGMVAEMLAAAMNSNCGGRDHGAIYVERKVIGWCKEIFGFPSEASGLLVSGTSMANLIALGVARNSLGEISIRKQGLRRYSRDLALYASSEVHESVLKAVEILGLGSGSLRRIPVDANLRIDLEALRRSIAEDRRAGVEPFCVVGSAGTVNTGAIDPLAELSSLCAAEKIWFHVDGAFGALAFTSDSLRPRLKGLELADSLAFDFHKWAQVQYDAGCVLVRRGDLHRAAYSMRPPYLQGSRRGLGGGEPWPCDFGPELSRGFRALKVWFALKEHGTQKIGHLIERNCEQASYLAQRISREPELELLAPVSMNIVCFRFKEGGLGASDLDALNEHIVEDLQEAGTAAPSTTRLNERLAIRVNITNHRTRRADCDMLVDAVLSAARARMKN